jgi:hypothetical protein
VKPGSNVTDPFGNKIKYVELGYPGEEHGNQGGVLVPWFLARFWVVLGSSVGVGSSRFLLFELPYFLVVPSC